MAWQWSVVCRCQSRWRLSEKIRWRKKQGENRLGEDNSVLTKEIGKIGRRNLSIDNTPPSPNHFLWSLYFIFSFLFLFLFPVFHFLSSLHFFHRSYPRFFFFLPLSFFLFLNSFLSSIHFLYFFLSFFLLLFLSSVIPFFFPFFLSFLLYPFIPSFLSSFLLFFPFYLFFWTKRIKQASLENLIWLRNKIRGSSSLINQPFKIFRIVCKPCISHNSSNTKHTHKCSLMNPKHESFLQHRLCIQPQAALGHKVQPTKFLSCGTCVEQLTRPFLFLFCFCFGGGGGVGIFFLPFWSALLLAVDTAKADELCLETNTQFWTGTWLLGLDTNTSNFFPLHSR